jgi:hypothetical protein
VIERITAMSCIASKKLESGKLNASAILRENKLLVTSEKSCIYCEKACDDLFVK